MWAYSFTFIPFFEVGHFLETLSIWEYCRKQNLCRSSLYLPSISSDQTLFIDLILHDPNSQMWKIFKNEFHLFLLAFFSNAHQWSSQIFLLGSLAFEPEIFDLLFFLRCKSDFEKSEVRKIRFWKVGFLVLREKREGRIFWPFSNKLYPKCSVIGIHWKLLAKVNYELKKKKLDHSSICN